jgi:acetoin utilization deacetylase AcuC-like enzyme
LGIDRVGIVDFDVHHGNGTQDIFYADADVLYISTHQWGIFPGTGARNEIGHEQGRGSTVNIPLPSGVGDNGFEEIYNKIVEPSLHRFDPEILLVSAGYDAHWNDPLASLQISSKGFFEITRKLVSYADDLCEGRMMMVLEGGYNPDALARSVRYSCHALVGEGLKETVEHKPSFTEPDIHPLLDDIRQIHSI